MTQALDTNNLVPVAGKQMLWLPGAAVKVAEALTKSVASLDYGVTTESEPSLVNTPLVIWPGPEAGLELGPLLEDLKQRAVYQEATLINFRQPDPAIAALWGSLDDGVMGGVSASQVRWREGLRFVGEVSTANSGGFASIRTRNLEPPLNLGQWQGTVLSAQGDGQRYKWILRDTSGWDSLAYCRSFDIEADRLSTVRTPFLEMVATRRARTVPEASPLNPAQLYSMQLMLSKFEYDGELNPAFQPGAFELTVQSLGVYRQGPKPLVILPRENTAECAQLLTAARLTGVIRQGESFATIGAADKLPPEVEPAVIKAVFEVFS
ncbi:MULTISPECIES: CIA30 family protein [Cyanophyceae]|uniref:CIA30 family protein n=1 Tax=Leptolyngbya subtilissima DQ-A4 TaxID=2933933 RepID=A0ABV0K5Q8_9CYAN|nr:CIA30 family protein [Nodosilinea sp. FACHB-141]MBD2114449.1 CIA30 family protein [Nodosilinea sp. FACHB-141]